MATAPQRPSFQFVPHLTPDALARALSALGARALFAVLPEGEAAQVPALQAACREAGVALCGALFPRLVHDGRFAGAGAWLYRLEPGAHFGLVEDLGADSAQAGARLALAARPSLDAAPADASLFLVFDATTPNVASIVDALYLELGHGTRFLGVSAGSETFQPMPCVFDAERLVQGALWLLLPTADRTVLMHDYEAVMEGSICTATSGNRVATIDFKPAFDVYRARLKAQYGVELNRENFYGYAAEYPFGIELASGQLLVRMPTSVEPDGAIRCVGEVPENAVLTIVHAPPGGAPQTAAALKRRLDDRHVGEGMLLFYCAGRRMRLGDESEADLRVLLAATGRSAGGATSLGEIGSMRPGGYPGFHNGAFVCLEW